jgi:hypothetical protein
VQRSEHSRAISTPHRPSKPDFISPPLSISHALIIVVRSEEESTTIKSSTREFKFKMSKSEKSSLPLPAAPAQPPPPYEAIESSRRVEARTGTATGTGPIDPEVGENENENTPLLGPIAPFPYHRNRIRRYVKALLIGCTLVLILYYASVKIIGSKGDEVWKKRVGVVG